MYMPCYVQKKNLYTRKRKKQSINTTNQSNAYVIWSLIARFNYKYKRALHSANKIIKKPEFVTRGWSYNKGPNRSSINPNIHANGIPFDHYSLKNDKIT